MAAEQANLRTVPVIGQKQDVYAVGRRLEEICNFEDALAMGMFFNSFIRHAQTVKMANLAQVVNVIAPMIVTPIVR